MIIGTIKLAMSTKDIFGFVFLLLGIVHITLALVTNQKK